MKMPDSIKYQRKIIGVEKKLGFLYVPAQAQILMPSETTQVMVQLQGEPRPRALNYNADYKRIFGLTSWYKSNKIDIGTPVDVELTTAILKISVASTPLIIEEIEDETKIAPIDISGLSSAAKGNIGEDRVKELILIYSQGLLNVFKPVIDNRGIDLIVLKEGVFMPIYLQIKTRYNVSKNDQLILTISGNTFKSHHAFYIIGISFNPKTLELDNKILFLPSKDLEKHGIKLNHKGNWRVAVSYSDTTKSKFAKYFINKEELVEKLIEKFESMAELIR